MLHVLVAGFQGLMSLATGSLCIAVLLEYSRKGNWLLIYSLFQENGTSTCLDFSRFPTLFIPCICLVEAY